MREYFFERIRPIVETAIQENRHDDWPIITLNLDFKSDEPEHHAAVWKLLGEYERWLCTAPRGADPADVQPMRLAPVLVLTGEQDAQQQDFSDSLPAARPLRLFGAVIACRKACPGPRRITGAGGTTPGRRSSRRDSRRQERGPPRTQQRLTPAVRAAHTAGLWIRYLHARRLRSGRHVRRLGRELQLRLARRRERTLARGDQRRRRLRSGQPVPRSSHVS